LELRVPYFEETSEGHQLLLGNLQKPRNLVDGSQRWREVLLDLDAEDFDKINFN
jgi:hypothetical protein